MHALLLGVALLAQARLNTRPAIYARIDSLTYAYFFDWNTGWMNKQNRWPAGYEFDPSQGMRIALFHCHYDRTPQFIRQLVIKAGPPSQAQCPYWYPDDEKPVADERLSFDNGVAAADRMELFAKRNELRNKIAELARRLPGDLGMARRQFRLAHDAGAQRDAWLIANACTEDRAQCALLRALALHDGGFIASSDSAFLEAGRMMKDADRCQWNDVANLVEPGLQVRYQNMSCSERAEFEKKMWWLADPMWSEPGNERRAEQYARKALWDVMAVLKHDGRQHFEPKYGGLAVREVLLRYGWPTQMYWAGPTHNAGHSTWLESHIPGHVQSLPAPPYAVREYSRGRLHTIPQSGLFDDPFHSDPEDWILDPSVKDHGWWPVEHFARDKSAIVQFRDWQTGMFLRANDTRYVWATNLDTATTVTLMVARAVDEATNVASAPGKAGSTVVIDAALQDGQVILSFESTGDKSHSAHRLRFGEYIAPPLRTLGSKHALSQPLLYDPTGAPATLDADDAVRRMLGTTFLKDIRRLGVFWEGYGFTSKADVDVSVRVIREDKSSKDPVAAHWVEDRGALRSIQRTEGPTEVQMRSVVLDLSELERGGRYRLTVSMKQGDEIAVSERRFQIP